MSDWQAGDLGVTIENECDDCKGGTSYLGPGIICLVTAVAHSQYWNFPSLYLAGHPTLDGSGWCACGFRKIRPDEHQACEPEFITLIKRSKVVA